MEVAGNKGLTKEVLGKAALPVPRGCVVETPEDAIACLATLESPLVVKPLDGNQGKGVSLNLARPEDVREAFTLAAKISDHVIVEEMYRGIDYRVVWWAARSWPRRNAYPPMSGATAFIPSAT